MSRKSFDRRERDDPAFADLVEHGRLCSQAWWLELGRKCAKAGAPAQAFSFWDKWMKNRYGWADKVETSDGKQINEMSSDEIAARIKQLNAKIEKKPANIEIQNLMAGTKVN